VVAAGVDIDRSQRLQIETPQCNTHTHTVGGLLLAWTLLGPCFARLQIENPNAHTHNTGVAGVTLLDRVARLLMKTPMHTIIIPSPSHTGRGCCCWRGDADRVNCAPARLKSRITHTGVAAGVDIDRVLRACQIENPSMHTHTHTHTCRGVVKLPVDIDRVARLQIENPQCAQ
jgi:hypothetical protein